MIKTGFETRVKVQQIIENQLPEFLRSESPKSIDFLKQYYISQEYQGGVADLANNLDQYLKFDNLTPEVVTGSTTLSSNITAEADTVVVTSTKGFPAEYGLFKIDDEIFTYTGITANSFTGCVRGFSAVTSYKSVLNPEELVFSTSKAAAHTSGATVKNLSTEFLREFYKKLKYTFTPGLENVDFVSDLDVNNFIKEARNLYESKGTEESFKILFKVLYGVTPKVIDLENYLIKPSTARFLRRENIVVERISGDPNKLIGQTIKKSSDSETQASVSEVEIFTRGGTTTYYKLSLFVGYDDKDTIEGSFSVQPKVTAINSVNPGGTVITVDSTIGFPSSGTLISGDNTITYTSKTVNQFLGCTGVTDTISIKDEIRINETYYGYEDGDITKRVDVRITGVLSKFNSISDIKLSSENQKIYVKNVGEKILNPSSDRTYKEIFSNSWVYNTSPRYQVESVDSTVFTLKSSLDGDISLKVGDSVNVLDENTEVVYAENAIVSSIVGSDVTLNSLTPSVDLTTVSCSLRRNLNTATSSGTSIKYGNDTIVSDVQNVYNENDDYFYIASNSLPSYEITSIVKKSSIATADTTTIQGYDNVTETYSIISFSSSVPFKTGDEVYYSCSGTSLSGLPEGIYYVKVLVPDNQIKLYRSSSLIESDVFVKFTFDQSSGSHSFVLSSQKDELISPQKILKKFPNKVNIKTGKNTSTGTGSLGLLSNGVEIISYKSRDKVYYGPLKNVQLYNGGSGYDIINPPTVEISAPTSGTTALAQPILRGELQEVIVDPQDFDIKKINSVTLTGGNGDGAILTAVLESRHREVEFDSRPTTSGGGVNVTSESLTFTTPHNFSNGEPIVYNRNGNNSIGVGTFGGSNAVTGLTLNSGSVYYTEVVSPTTIRLYQTLVDYNSGINTVGFTTSSAQGIHKFRTFESKNTLRSIKVINKGHGYQNRKLYVKPDGVSTVENNITFKNHGFSDGEIVTYSTTGSVIGGLSTSNRYYIIKQDSDRFRLANAGVGGTITSNYTREDYVDITGTGSGYHNFSYPNIEINIDAEYDGVSGIITATPVITGEITDLHLYEEGTGYGSEVINFHKKPTVSIKSGKDVELKPIVIGGKITEVVVTNSGSEYSSPPNLTVNGVGIGAKLRAIVSGGSVTSVVVVNNGTNYDSNTTISAVSKGLNASAEANVRDLTINSQNRFGDEILIENQDNNQGLEYGAVAYASALRTEFSESGSSHSPIIGWAYDGNPIYGPYGYTDANDINSAIKALESGYVESISSVTNRPPSYSAGFFVEDYQYTGGKDLDRYNGRYARTPEFPNGVYAYFASIDSSTLNSTFPYFIGNNFRSLPLDQSLDQDYDFNKSSLIRNTFPYGVSEDYVNNDFILESNELFTLQSNIDSVTRGEVSNLNINFAGSGYAVGDVASFDNTGTGGGGLSADVKSIVGKSIVDVTTTVETYQSAKVIRENENTISLHIDKVNNIVNGDKITVSNLSTFIENLTGSHTVGVTTDNAYLLKQMPSNAVSGVVTDFYVSRIPSSLSIGSTVEIGTEYLSVINIFPDNKVIRALRGITGTAHTVSTEASVLTGKLTLSLPTDYFDSRLNDKVYFNPTQSLGIGSETGISTSNSYTIGDLTKTISVPTQSIYLPNHPFKTSQPVVFNKVTGSNTVSVSNTEGSAQFAIPSGNSQTLYVINKSKNYIGLTTEVGLTTNTSGLYFQSFTANGNDTDYQYNLETNFTQVTAKVEEINAVVSVSTQHSLSSNDIVSLTVLPNQSVGIGTSTAVVVKYNASNNKLLINPIGFTSAVVSVTNNTLSLTSHDFETGDKVFYDSSDEVISGLVTGSYYVYRIDDNTINLAETYYDSTLAPPSVVSFASTGGSGHEISKINPKIESIRNNNLVFDVSDSSLSGYNFNIYQDKNFLNDLVSIGSSTSFNVSGVGTVGVSANAKVTINYGSDLPETLFYNLEKSGYISTSDTDVKNASEISLIDSYYNGSYPITSVGSTTFTISLRTSPENLNYTQSNTETLKYSTTSLTERGGIDSMRIVSKGTNYKKLPKFVSVASTTGVDVDIIPESTNIGRINQVTIENEGFDFSADKTLSPEAFVSPIVNLVDRDTITQINVTSSGSNYSSAPDLVVVNSTTKQPYNSGLLEAVIQGTGISGVNIIDQPKGLSSGNNKVYAINNSNGVGISSVTSFTPSSVTFVLTTPISGFTTDVFTAGEKVFVENVVKSGTSGDGFNSSDLGYNFFPVVSYTNSNPAIVTIDISDHTTNPGFAQTSQSSYASIIKESHYPIFSTTQETLEFNVGEGLTVLRSGVYYETDLIITENLDSSVKIKGTYQLEKSDVITGKNSGSQAKISSIVDNKAFFAVDYSNRRDIGWSNDIGKLNTDSQVIPDNDYYQNLSYTVKSPKEYDDIINPVNRLLHTSGLKNFADTEITNTSSVGVGSTNASSSLAVINIVEEKRVDTIKDFDLVLDVDTFDSKSKFLEFKTKSLTPYIDCRTNLVLPIDDISSRFSNTDSGDSELYLDVVDYDVTSGYNKFLVQIKNTDGSEIQTTEVITIPTTSNDIITAERGSIYNTNTEIGELSGFISDATNQLSLRFTPSDPFTKDYDVKVLRNNFTTDLVGVGTSTVGFIDLTSTNTSVAAASSETVFSSNVSSTKSLFINAEVKNLTTNEINYVEVYVDHNGTDTYISEYYVDNNELLSINQNFIGNFSADISGGVISVDYVNQDPNAVLVRTKTVGFGLTSVGIGTHIFKSSGQPDSTVKTARLQTNYETTTGVSTIFTVSKTDVSSIKSYLRVGYGNTTALHQLLVVGVGTDAYLTQYPFISDTSPTGIGTFDSGIVGSNLVVNFYPDANVTGIVTTQIYSEIIQTESDFVNEPNNLTYGTILESYDIKGYNGRNGSRGNILDFELKTDGTPIFQKTFDPTSSSILTLGTGTFTITNHFFKTGEKLNYLSASSFDGASSSDIQVSGAGNLPSEVYVIRVNDSQFRLATSKANAVAGTAVTFSSAGTGNAHTLEMSKRMEKTILTVDEVIQSPISYTKKQTDLFDNGGSINTTSTFFSVTGISSLLVGDLLKIDDEYIEVVSVGLGTTSIGPITETGSFNVVEGTRGAVGSVSSTHTDGTTANVYSGSFNIVNNKVYFTEAPRGNSTDSVDNSNLPTPRSSFGGRVYLRNDYTTNKIYDNISKEFTGIGATYTVTVGGANTTGIETGSGLVLINDIFQTPSTQNNAGNNYEYAESVGITSIIFTGITTVPGADLFISDYDVNQNQLPRGGVIVSLGSTPGLGYAPLVGASVTAVVGAGGSIVSVGLGTTDYHGSGYNGIVSIGISVFEENHDGDTASITAIVGAGGTLAFAVGAGGTGYTNPQIFVSEPSYENLQVTGVSRRGIGATTDTGTGLLISVDTGYASTTGIGSTLFGISSFNITRPGYGFKVGDVFTPVGLVTDVNLSSVVNQFELTVIETFTDSFASWQFGELDYIDSIESLQDGNRTRFPLNYNGSLLSFETSNPDLDLNYLLLIFINGILQEPGEAYSFNGGTSVIFTEAPSPVDPVTGNGDKVSIFFYRGTRNEDSVQVGNDVIKESVKPGDTVQVRKNETNSSTVTQEERIIFNLTDSSTTETNIYSGAGIDEVNYKPIDWTKQKVDAVIAGEIVSKSRDSIESQVYPTARIIGDLTTTDTEVFVDDAQFFNYEENESSIVISSVNGLIVTGSDPVAAAITAVVSVAGTISSLTINDGGSGYSGSSVSISIAAPSTIGVGIGTTATATATITGGSITSATIVNPGLGYTQTQPPQVLAPTTNVSYENILEIDAVVGSSGIVTGITATTGSGTPVGIRFFLNSTDSSPWSGLVSGYPIYIFDTGVGSGVTSIDDSDSAVVGVGTSFANNIYTIQTISSSSQNAEILVNVDSGTNTVGLGTTGSITSPVGRFSWGRLSGFTRASSPISIGVTGLTIDSGLSTFPTIQRRGYGLRQTGGLRKDLG
jgi:hypothetical protein